MRRSLSHSLTMRRAVMICAVTLVSAILGVRVVQLQAVSKDFLKTEGDARYLRVIDVATHRGVISDRNGEPLAISTPVDSIWADPRLLNSAKPRWKELAGLLEVDPSWLAERIAAHAGREFVYLKRQVPPQLAATVSARDIPGVFLQREYRRYYPTGEVSAHVVGFTNVDDVGQEGLELAYDEHLRGRSGSKRVIKDRLGRVVENVESVREPIPGRDISLSLDQRLQYLAYRELLASVHENQAVSGSVVVIDVRTGEVLALVNQPSYNPNNRDTLRDNRYRNRASTDVFEPGSTIKPFTIGAALETRRYRPTTLVDTSPGLLRLGSSTIRDLRDYGRIDLTGVIQKSSNVGASKIALALDSEQLWRTFQQVGFGSATQSGFPGESSGVLNHYAQWRDIEKATLAFGYGLAVTPLQLARAYTVIASGGIQRPLSFLRQDAPVSGERVMRAETAAALTRMLEEVVGDGGTGRRARVNGYRIAGKTGTVRKSSVGGYIDDRYVAVFAGFAPATRPRVAVVAMINEPRAGEYYGGEVAAPLFSRVVAGALRLLGVPPDAAPGMHGDRLTKAVSGGPAAAVTSQERG